MSKKLICAGVMIVLVVGTAIISSYIAGHRKAEGPEQRPEVSGVAVAAAEAADVPEFRETAGTLNARVISEVASRVTGSVTALKVKQGDKVRAGDVLLEIDSRDLEERYKGAQAACEEANKALEAARERKLLAETTYNRYKVLVEQNAVARQQMDEVSSQKRVADSEFERAIAAAARAASGLEEAGVMLGYTKVTAPTDGVVTTRNIEVGSMAQPGVPLITVEDSSEFRVDVNVDERLAGVVKVGQEADVVIESLGAKLKGQVTEVVPSVDPMSRTFLVKIVLPSGKGLCTGLHARVYIPMGTTKKATLVPQAAVVRRGQLTGVYVVNADNIISYRLVRTGRNYADKVEVLAGLTAGERVITDGTDRAVEGGIVRAVAE
jgi:RND family efflux transporter MFP subunit